MRYTDDWDDEFYGRDGEESPLGPLGCLFPGRCCMPGEHYESECHTPEDLEAFEEATRLASTQAET